MQLLNKMYILRHRSQEAKNYHNLRYVIDEHTLIGWEVMRYHMGIKSSLITSI